MVNSVQIIILLYTLWNCII